MTPLSFLKQQLKTENSEPSVNVVSVLMDVERRLRELATDLQLRTWEDPLRDKVTQNDLMEIKNIWDSVNKLFSWSDAWEKELAPYPLYEENSELSSLVDKVRKVRSAFSDLADAVAVARDIASSCEGLPYHDPFCIEKFRESNIRESVERLRSKVRELTGRECGFSITLASESQKFNYTLPLILNDISNCAHILAEWLPSSGLHVGTRRIGERCNAFPDADERLLDLCVRWDRMVTEKSNKYDEIYDPFDYGVLTALVGRDEATFRVGSSPEHATVVKKDGTIVYHDRDESVIEGFRYAMETALEYSCKTVFYDKLECTPPDPNILNDPNVREMIADVLSWATSADFRIQELMDEYIGEYCEKECKENLSSDEEEDEDEEDLELRLEKCIDECMRIIKEERGIGGEIAVIDLEKYTSLFESERS